MTTRYSVVVLAYRNRDLTERCLESLAATMGADGEIVVVDNGCPEDSAALLERWRDRATTVSLPENRNFAGGNNEGARRASGEVLVFLNNDTIATPGAMETLVREALRSDVGVVGPRLIYPDGTLQQAGFGWRRSVTGALPTFHWFHHEPAELPAAGAVFDLDVVTGACVALRREVFDQLGGWDEVFVNGAEDVDLCIKARLAGYRVVYRGDAQVIHDEGKATEGDYGRDGNILLLQSRYGQLMDDDSERLALLFDARFNHHADGVPVAHGAEPATLSLEGHVSGLAPEAYEARAVIACVGGGGVPVSARDWQPNWIVPRLTELEWHPVLAARTLPKLPTAVVLHVPGGSGYSVPDGVAVVRAGALPAALPAGAAVWAASPGLADRFIDMGAAPSDVAYIPPSIAPGAVGEGGEGVLILLPAHDLPACAALLKALPRGHRVRLLPDVASPPLLDLVAELAPDAELFAPMTSEVRLYALARECDVVVDLDPRDVFGRRALTAAAAGAAVVTIPGGAAAAVLGEHPCDTIDAALERTSERRERSAAVALACAPDAVQRRIAASPTGRFLDVHRGVSA